MKKYFLVFLLAGCEMVSTQEDNKLESNSEVTRYITFDEQLAKIEDNIEGFGGYYFTKDGELEIFIQEDAIDSFDNNKKIDLVEEISSFHPDLVNKLKTQTSQFGVNIRQSKFTYKQLNNWRNLIREYSYTIGKVSFLDIDETNNKITLGLAESEIDDSEIQNFLKNLEIPHNSIDVIFREIPIVETQSIEDCIMLKPTENVEPQCGSIIDGGGSGGGPSGGSNTIKLTDSFSTYVGGIGIGNDLSSVCTMGINVSWDNDSRKGFVTASHCTETMASLDGGDFYQPYKNTTKIGEEVVDRLPWDYTLTPSCPTDHDGQDVVCRYSDAALIEYSNSKFQNAELGYVASPASINSNELASIGDLYGYELVGESWPYKNMNVHMIGKNSGLSIGEITRSCTDATFYKDGQLYYIICAAEANYDALQGDSGAPILTSGLDRWNDYGYLDFTARIVGFHLGAAGPDYVYFSSAYYTIGNIWSNSGGSCNYANFNGENWLNSELCDEPFYGPFEIRAIGNR